LPQSDDYQNLMSHFPIFCSISSFHVSLCFDFFSTVWKPHPDTVGVISIFFEFNQLDFRKENKSVWVLADFEWHAAVPLTARPQKWKKSREILPQKRQANLRRKGNQSGARLFRGKSLSTCRAPYLSQCLRLVPCNVAANPQLQYQQQILAQRVLTLCRMSVTSGLAAVRGFSCRAPPDFRISIQRSVLRVVFFRLAAAASQFSSCEFDFFQF